MRKMTWTKTLTLGVLTAGLLGLGAAPASAATLTVNGWTAGEQVLVQSTLRSGMMNTAELDVTTEGLRGFSYCVDLPQTIGAGGTSGWTLSDPELSAGVLRAAWLVEYARPQFETLGVGKATAIAALQVSIWEVLADAPGAYNLYAGDFALRSDGTSTGVMNLARGFLGALASADLAAFETSAIWATHVSRQDQIVFGPTNPIPEPSSFVLFALGAGLVAFAGSRKTA